MIELKNVAIIGIEGCTDKPTRTLNAIKKSSENISFGCSLLLTATKMEKYDSPAKLTIEIPGTTSAGYQQLVLTLNDILKQLDHLIPKTITHYLFVQYDGYVLNPSAWTDEFLKYDYIGAQWFWYKDDAKVGNGGFSLRSRRLIETVTNIYNSNKQELDKYIKHGEDTIICRLMRKTLEQSCGIVFASPEIADKFSTENRQYNQSFGWHGQNIIPKEAVIFQDIAEQNQLVTPTITNH